MNWAFIILFTIGTLCFLSAAVLLFLPAEQFEKTQKFRDRINWVGTVLIILAVLIQIKLR